MQAKLSPRREHAVRFGYASRYEIVNHDAEIGLRAGEDDLLLAAGPKAGIGARQEPLCGGLLVACRAIDLTGQIEARQPLQLQRGPELARVDIVVFDRVARPDDADVLEARHGLEERLLHLGGQGGREAVRIDRRVVEALGLEEDLVRVAISEPDDLILDRGAIARPTALNPAGIHGGAMDIVGDDAVRLGRRTRDVAVDLRRRNCRRQRRKRLRRVVAGLCFEHRKVDGRSVETRRRARLQPSQPQAQRLEPRRQTQDRLLADTASRDGLLAAMDKAAEEGSGRQDHRRGRKPAPVEQDDSCYIAGVDNEVIDFTLDDRQVRLRTELSLHCLFVELAIRLRTRAADGRALTAVENAELDAGGIGHAAHDPVQRIDLADEVTLAQPADGGVAAHLSDRRELMGDEGRRHPKPRRCRCSL